MKKRDVLGEADTCLTNRITCSHEEMMLEYAPDAKRNSSYINAR